MLDAANFLGLMCRHCCHCDEVVACNAVCILGIESQHSYVRSFVAPDLIAWAAWLLDILEDQRLIERSAVAGLRADPLVHAELQRTF